MEAVDRQRHLERELVDTMDRKVRSQERLLAMKDATIAELELRMTSMELTSYDGTLLWRITEFQRKRQDAISGHVTSIYSPPFFTSRTGKLDVGAELDCDCLYRVAIDHCQLTNVLYWFTAK